MPPNANKALEVATTMMDTPLPALVERLGLSVAQAQAALDRNALDVAKEMAQLKIDLGGTEYSMLELGFTPSFYPTCRCSPRRWWARTTWSSSTCAKRASSR